MEITYVDGDDWVGLYVDGKLVEEGHSLQTKYLLQLLSEKLGFKFDTLYPNLQWMEDRGCLPKELKDVKD